ncbi:Tannase/feruloyl esterase [Limtongia smithiae]|uniref:Tannase/feruloyl esterase n=1 Tax=Limtongia smithiae TaxID=1125753 RepID=UPI0034CFA7AD
MGFLTKVAQFLGAVTVLAQIASAYSKETVFASYPDYEDDEFAASCLAFEPEAYIYNSTLTNLNYVPAGTNINMTGNDMTCGRPNQTTTVDMCRISLFIATSNQSSIVFEAWLPRVWSGRLLGTGNGGIDGCVKYEDLAYGTQYGFATVGSNNGHNGTYFDSIQNDDVIEDFAYRSLHTMIESGKILVNEFYGAPHNKSYYLGCSLGGRQGIHAAEVFPEDFDGIVAGSPALDFNNMVSWRGHFFPITGSNMSENFITNEMWTGLIHEEVLRQCDGLDGVYDGIIEDPTLCIFRPEAIMCGPDDLANSTYCLNPFQVEQVNEIFAPYYGIDGQLIYPAMQPGSEIQAIQRLYAGAPFPYSRDWFKYVVFKDPYFDPAYFNRTHAAMVAALNPFNIQTYPNNLTNFMEAGGKIVTYHGQQDNQITSFNSIRFYNHLQRGMNMLPYQLDDFYRFFRISGMFHCSAGPGAWVIGQGGGKSFQGIPFEPEYNVLAAVVAWVENGTAPMYIEGTKFVNDTVYDGVSFTRKHCKYPARNTYMGGDSYDPMNWMCVE